MAMKGLDHQRTSARLRIRAMGGKRNCLVDCNLVPEKLRSVQMFGRRVGVVKVYADTANLFLLLDIVML